MMLHFRVQDYCITKKRHVPYDTFTKWQNEITFIIGQIRVQTWNDSSSVCAREKYTFENGDRVVAHCSTLTCVVGSECLNLA